MDQLDQDLTRFKKPAMALVGGIAAALVVATLPSVYLEKIIGMTGVAEIVPAAAPPLGNTAKSLLAVFAGLVSTSVVFYFLYRKGDADMGLAIRKLANWEEEKAEWEERKNPKKMKFSLKKLLQKPKKKKGEVKDLSDLPNLREKDSHPDAPARQPIFADKDLGSPIESKIKPFDAAETAEVPVEPAQTEPDVTPAPFVMDKSLQPPAPIQQEQEVPLDLSGQVSVPPVSEVEQPLVAPESNASPVVEAEAPMAPQAAPAPFTAPEPVAPAESSSIVDPLPVLEPVPASVPEPELVVEAVAKSKEDLSALSIAELADRLEAGLTKLQQIQQPTTLQSAATVAPVQTEAPASGGISVSSSDAVTPSLKPVEPTQEEIEAKRQADMDDALKAALGTLEKMTAQR